MCNSMNPIIKIAALFTSVSIIVTLYVFIYFGSHDDSISAAFCTTSSLSYLCRITDICTNTCYLSNMYRLHKCELHNKVRLPFLVMLLLLMSGNIALNPGPVNEVMFPCGVCQLAVNWSHKAVACDNCSVWVHKSCASMDTPMYTIRYDTIR